MASDPLPQTRLVRLENIPLPDLLNLSDDELFELLREAPQPFTISQKLSIKAMQQKVLSLRDHLDKQKADPLRGK